MNRIKAIHIGLAFLFCGCVTGSAIAATSNDFVDSAAAGGIAEVEAGKLALEKSGSADVKAFANQMIKDHTAVDQKLSALAGKLDIKVPDEAALTDKAKAKVLEMRDTSFDKAYANNQVKAHEDAVALFKKEAGSSDPLQLKAFAQHALPELEHHLDMAKKLQAGHSKDN
jgi:putative membrane protein